MKERIKWVDTFRAVMIFFIVLGHTLSSDIKATLEIKTYIYSFHVPAFFFISGFLFSSRGNSFWFFLKSKFLSLMVPYYSFSIASIAIFSLLGTFTANKLNTSVTSGGIWENILGMLYGNGTTGNMQWNLPLWFIPCLFITLLIFYAIEKFISKLKNYKLYFVFSIIILALPFLNFYILKLKTLPLGLETSIYMMPFFACGYWLKSCIKTKNPPKNISLLISGISLIVLGGVLGLLANQKIEYVSSDYGNLLLFYISAFISVAGWVLLCQKINGKIFDTVGQNTLPILLMHKFPILLFQIILSLVTISSIGFIVSLTVLVAFLSCALSIFAGFLITKICPFLLGKKRKNSI